MEQILRRHNSAAISYQVSPDSLLDVSSCNIQSVLVDEQELLEVRWGCKNISQVVAVQGSSFAPTT
jgi:hypothetical protein